MTKTIQTQIIDPKDGTWIDIEIEFQFSNVKGQPTIVEIKNVSGLVDQLGIEPTREEWTDYYQVQGI